MTDDTPTYQAGETLVLRTPEPALIDPAHDSLGLMKPGEVLVDCNDDVWHYAGHDDDGEALLTHGQDTMRFDEMGGEAPFVYLVDIDDARRRGVHVPD